MIWGYESELWALSSEVWVVQIELHLEHSPPTSGRSCSFPFCLLFELTAFWCLLRVVTYMLLFFYLTFSLPYRPTDVCTSKCVLKIMKTGKKQPGQHQDINKWKKTLHMKHTWKENRAACHSFELWKLWTLSLPMVWKFWIRSKAKTKVCFAISRNFIKVYFFGTVSGEKS